MRGGWARKRRLSRRPGYYRPRMSGTAVVSEAPRVSVILCGTSNDDVTWANEAFAKRKDVALSVHLQQASPLNWDESSKTGGGEALCFLRHIMTSSEAIGDVTVFSPASPRCGSPHPAATAGCIAAFVRIIAALASGAATVEPLGFAPLLSPFPRAQFHAALPASAFGCLGSQYTAITGRDLNEDQPFLSSVPGGAFAVRRENLMAAPHDWMRQAANQTRSASFYDNVDDCCKEGNTCTPWLLETLWPTVFAAPMRTCKDTEVTARNPVARAICANDKFSLSTSAQMRFTISRISRWAQFGNHFRGQEASSLLDLITHEAHFERLRATGRWGASRAGDCDSRLCKIFSGLDAGRGGNKKQLLDYLNAHMPTDLKELPDRAHNRCIKPFLTKGWLAASVQRVQLPQGGSTWPPPGWQSEVYGNLLHSALHKYQRTCLERMKRERRWYRFPDVYGLEWPGSPAF